MSTSFSPVPSSPSPMPHGRKPPSKRNLKAAVLWCSRWLLGDGEFYRGRIAVEIEAVKEGETLKVVPTREVDGLSEPPSLSPAANQQTTPAELLAVLFSRDEIRILSEMLGECSVKASGVQSATKISESKFWTLWGNLQQRGIVGDAEQGEGFVIGLPWVKELMRTKVEGASPAA